MGERSTGRHQLASLGLRPQVQALYQNRGPVMGKRYRQLAHQNLPRIASLANQHRIQHCKFNSHYQLKSWWGSSLCPEQCTRHTTTLQLPALKSSNRQSLVSTIVIGSGVTMALQGHPGSSCVNTQSVCPIKYNKEHVLKQIAGGAGNVLPASTSLPGNGTLGLSTVWPGLG